MVHPMVHPMVDYICYVPESHICVVDKKDSEGVRQGSHEQSQNDSSYDANEFFSTNCLTLSRCFSCSAEESTGSSQTARTPMPSSRRGVLYRTVLLSMTW